MEWANERSLTHKADCVPPEPPFHDCVGQEAFHRLVVLEQVDTDGEVDGQLHIGQGQDCQAVKVLGEGEVHPGILQVGALETGLGVVEHHQAVCNIQAVKAHKDQGCQSVLAHGLKEVGAFLKKFLSFFHLS